jgi:hypothetical protein
VLTFTPQQAGCSNQYQFWLLPPGGSWQVMQAYGVGATWAWNTAGYPAGTYEVGVWEGSSSAPSSYESYAITSFALGAFGCSAVALTESPGPSQLPGATVSVAASAAGCGSPQFQFWLLSPTGGWSVTQAYSPTASWTWNTAGLPAGTYQVGVWARQSGSAASYDAWLVGTYQLAVAACASATLSASPAAPVAAGTRVTFTAAAPGCASPQFEFWGKPPGSNAHWLLLQFYGSGASFVWDSTGAPSGAYSFAVWATAAGSLNDYDVYATTPFSVS